MNRFIVLLTACMLHASVSFSQELNKQKLDSLFEILAIKNKAMGSVAISRDGNIVYSRTTGFRAVVKNKRLKTDDQTRFRIGPLSMIFTAVLTLQQMEANHLQLSDKLVDYISDVPNSNVITIRQLLYHSTGIYDFTSEPDYQEWMDKPIERGDLLTKVYKELPAFEPGTDAAFSKTNYVLLGYILEQVTRKPYQQILEEGITDRIGLKNTNFGSKINVNNNDAASFIYDEGWLQVAETDPSITQGSGAITSTPSDMVRFMDALFSGKLISLPSLQQMTKIHFDFGMGLMKFTFMDKTAFGQTGGIDGFMSTVCYFPKEKLAVAYCSNGYEYPVNDILMGIVKICFDEPYDIPTFKRIVLPEKDLMVFTGEYHIQESPLHFDIFIRNGSLYAKPTDEDPFRLEARESNIFVYDKGGAEFEFYPKRNEMVLVQSGVKFVFTRK